MAKKRNTSAVPIASPEDASSFIESLQEAFPGKPRSVTDKERLREYLGRFSNERLRSIMRRALMNMVQHAAQAEGKRSPANPGNRNRKKPVGRVGRTRR
jgi:hypothetical protein